MDPFYLSLVALVFGVIGLCSSVYVVVRYDPIDVFRRLETVEDGAPWSVMRQEMHAWTLQTEALLESAGVKLAKAHQRKGGRPRLDAVPEGPPPPMTRAQELDHVRQQLGMKVVG